MPERPKSLPYTYVKENLSAQNVAIPELAYQFEFGQQRWESIRLSSPKTEQQLGILYRGSFADSHTPATLLFVPSSQEGELSPSGLSLTRHYPEGQRAIAGRYQRAAGNQSSIQFIKPQYRLMDIVIGMQQGEAELAHDIMGYDISRRTDQRIEIHYGCLFTKGMLGDEERRQDYLVRVPSDHETEFSPNAPLSVKQTQQQMSVRTRPRDLGPAIHEKNIFSFPHFTS